MSFHSPLINVMVASARKAGRGLVRDFGEIEQLQVSRKGPADFVSQADLKAENLLVAELSKARPAVGFLREEGGETIGADPKYRWIIDPLDGTTNFLHGIPHFAISIAFEKEGEVIAAVIFNPVNDELFWAEKGKGAYFNDKRLRVAARRELRDAVVATGITHMGRPEPERFLQELNNVMGEVAGIRRFGAAALDLAYVAAGRFDAYWERNIGAWDMAAGLLMVREAGGVVSDLAGGPNLFQTGGVLAANDQLHRLFLGLVGDKALSKPYPPSVASAAT
jgi:myo-inositol-1(or 4)-monophosphatase